MQTIRLKDELYRKVRSSAFKKGVSLTSEMNNIVSKFYKDEIDKDYVIDEEIEDKEENKKILLSMKYKLWKKLKEEAIKNYCSLNRYINIILNNKVSEEKEYTNLELEELHESNYQLLAIGNNLNQLTKRINERREKVEDIDRILIQVLKEYIEDHTEKAGKLLTRKY